MRLIITNGDCAVNLMREAGFKAQILPWRDVLHDGPIDASLSLSDMSTIRAKFIAEQGWGELAQLKSDFINRDQTLSHWTDYGGIELWFEHDLYDQLQLLQILNYFYHQPNLDINAIKVLFTDQYLGRCTPASINLLCAKLSPLTNAQLVLAQRVWHTLGSRAHSDFNQILVQDLSCLPFLRTSLIRLLQEYPNLSTGCSRSEYQILLSVAKTALNAGQAFAACQKMEPAIYMGDSSFFKLVNDMLKLKQPLITASSKLHINAENFKSVLLEPSEEGRQLLLGLSQSTPASYVKKYIGAVYIDENCALRWCDTKQSLVPIQ